MYEMLFHGKKLDTGEWVEGFYHYRDYVFSGETVRKHYILPINAQDAVEVTSYTVGRSTGLTDKNGKKIFEGDIVKYMDDGYVATGVARFGLYASAGAAFAGHEGFYLDWAGCDWLRKDIGFWATMRPIEVIGNIYDNPELLEVRHAE